jgi:hypothetical protein
MGKMAMAHIDYCLKGSMPAKIAWCFVAGRSAC